MRLSFMKAVRSKLGVATLLACAIGLVAAFLCRDREPSYKGQSLTEWLLIAKGRYSRGHSRDAVEESYEAVRHIGTNALPCLVKWLAHVRPAWKTKLYGQLLQSRYGFLRGKFIGGFFFTRADERVIAAQLGFEILGEEAKPAIPELMHLSRRPGNISARAMLAIADMHQAGLEPMLSILSDPSHPGRAEAAHLAAYMHENAAIPILAKLVDDSDAAVAANAAIALSSLQPGATQLITRAQLAYDLRFQGIIYTSSNVRNSKARVVSRNALSRNATAANANSGAVMTNHSDWDFSTTGFGP